MPSETPTSANGYQWPPAPARSIMDRLAWNIFGADLHARLLALEDINDGIEALQAELQTFGVERLNDAINPLIASTQATLDQLIIDMNAAIAALNADLAAAQDAIDLLLAGGVPAANIAESATRVFVTPEQKADIDQLRTDLTAANAAFAAFKAGALAVVNDNATAVAGDELYVTTTGGVRTITLPADPTTGNRVILWRDGANLVTVDRNGQTIADLAENMNIDTDKTKAKLKFDGSTWRVTGEYFA